MDIFLLLQAIYTPWGIRIFEFQIPFEPITHIIYGSIFQDSFIIL